MPFAKFVFRPGINKEGTNYSNEGGWFDADKVRFRKGRPERIGGWEKNSSNTFIGTCRKINTYSTATQSQYNILKPSDNSDTNINYIRVSYNYYLVIFI